MSQRKTPYTWEAKWLPEKKGAWVPAVTVAAWTPWGARQAAQRLMPCLGWPSEVRKLDAR